MGIVRSFVRIVVSLVGALVPLLFLSGSYSPVRSYLPNVLGKESALYTSLQSAIGTSIPIGVLPFGTAGITGVVLYQVVQRVLGRFTLRHTRVPRLTLHRCSVRCKERFLG